MSGSFPGPIYAVCPQPRSPDWDAFVRNLLYVHSGGQRYVALFTSKDLAERWVAENDPPDLTMKPFGFTEQDEFILFLIYLSEHGHTYVGLDPSTAAPTAFVTVAEMLRVVRGS